MLELVCVTVQPFNSQNLEYSTAELSSLHSILRTQCGYLSYIHSLFIWKKRLKPCPVSTRLTVGKKNETTVTVYPRYTLIDCH